MKLACSRCRCEILLGAGEHGASERPFGVLGGSLFVRVRFKAIRSAEGGMQSVEAYRHEQPSGVGEREVEDGRKRGARLHSERQAKRVAERRRALRRPVRDRRAHADEAVQDQRSRQRLQSNIHRRLFRRQWKQVRAGRDLQIFGEVLAVDGELQPGVLAHHRSQATSGPSTSGGVAQ